MAKKDLTEIVCVVDKSGSMNTIVHDAIGGFNTFLEMQKQVPGQANMTIVLFDSQYEVLVNGKDIHQIQPLSTETYVPGGMTALYDAVGRTIDAVGLRLHNTPEVDRPERVVFAILTDGEENSSKEYSREVVFDKIKHQTEVYSWQFIFLAANQDSIQSAESIGIDGKYARDFTADSDGVADTFSSVNQAIASYRQRGTIDDDWK